MRGGFGAVGEQTGALEHHIDLFRSPGQFGRIANGAHRNSIAVDGETFLIMLDIGFKRAVNRVVLEQMRIDSAVSQVVDGDDLQILAIALGIECSKDVTTNSAKTIDCDS